MIQDVDESLRALVKRDALNGSKADIAFDAPNKEWSSRRNTPTVYLYLYDIREDLEQREVMWEDIRGDSHNARLITERRPPPREFKLSYLVTAWTQRPEDEHRLLSAVLSCFLPIDALPADVLKGEVADQPYPLRVTIGLPLPADRAISDVWSALGGELKASLDLVVTAPFDTRRRRDYGPPVIEERIVMAQLQEEPIEPTIGGVPAPLPGVPAPSPVYRRVAEELCKEAGTTETQ